MWHPTIPLGPYDLGPRDEQGWACAVCQRVYAEDAPGLCLAGDMVCRRCLPETPAERWLEQLGLRAEARDRGFRSGPHIPKRKESLW